MNSRLILTLTLLIGIFSTSLIAADYNPPKKPEMTLSATDMTCIDNAIKSDFKNLSSKDKKKLKSFLLDYSKSAKSEKGTTISPKSGPDKKSKKSGKSGIKTYRGGKITKGNSAK